MCGETLKVKQNVAAAACITNGVKIMLGMTACYAYHVLLQSCISTRAATYIVTPDTTADWALHQKLAHEPELLVLQHEHTGLHHTICA